MARGCRRESTIHLVRRGRLGRATIRAWRRGRSDRRGVSDVVGTILLLALTVTLFSSIFLFVDSFPQPPPQPASQFTAHLLYNGSKISGVTVLHLSGPTLAGTSYQIYLYSSKQPHVFPGSFTLASGLNGTSTWNLGQSWYKNLSSYNLVLGDNITVSIISTTQLLFRITLPGSTPVLPPQFFAEGTIPATPSVGQAFTLYAQIYDPLLKSWSVYANVSAVPGSGLASSDKMTYQASSGDYVLSFPVGASALGTFYVFVNATDNNSQRNTIAIPVVISTGTSGTPSTGISIAVAPLPVVNDTAETIYATVQNTGATTSAVTATFFAGVTSLGVVSGTIPGGGSTTLTKAWTPRALGTAVLTVEANITSGGSPTGVYNVTVFPRLLLIAHSVTAGTRLSNNTSAYLAQEIQAAGFPFTELFVACNVALPTTAALQAYDVVVIDFGDQAAGTCDASPSTTEQAKITGAMAGASVFTSFLLVGADLWKGTTCATYSASFLADFGVTSSGATCTATTTTAGGVAATYTSVPAKGFRADGIGALSVNKTLAGSSGFVPIAYFTNGGSNTFLATGGHTVGTFTKVSGLAKGVVLGTDPALLMTTLGAPASSAWGVNAGGTSVIYNALDYLSGFSSSTTPGRAFADYAISGAQIYGTSSSHLSSVYVTVRGNGATGGLISVSLTVTGTIALFGGAPVTATVYALPNGQNTTIVLTWESPTPGPYTLGVVATAVSGGLFGSQAQVPMTILNQPTVFAA